MPLPPGKQEALLAAFKGESDLAVAIYAEMIKLPPRPDRAVVEDIARWHGVSFEECLDVADRISLRMKDILALYDAAG